MQISDITSRHVRHLNVELWIKGTVVVKEGNTCNVVYIYEPFCGLENIT